MSCWCNLAILRKPRLSKPKKGLMFYLLFNDLYPRFLFKSMRTRQPVCQLKSISPNIVPLLQSNTFLLACFFIFVFEVLTHNFKKEQHKIARKYEPMKMCNFWPLTSKFSVWPDLLNSIKLHNFWQGGKLYHFI